MRPSRLLLTALVLPSVLLGRAVAGASASPPTHPTLATCDASVAPAGRVIVLLRKTPTDATAGEAGVLAQLKADRATVVTRYWIIDAVAATVSVATSCSLSRDASVTAVVPDRQLHLDPLNRVLGGRRVQILASRPATTVTEPESLSLTGATTVQAAGDTGKGVLVADIDSGLDTTQPNMQGVLATNGSGQQLYKDFTGTGLQDSMGHGTGTAGMMVSQGTTTYEVSTTPYYGPISGDPTVVTPFRVLGMAPGAKLIDAKVFDASLKGNGGYESWIVSAIQWVVANHAQVVNESWGWQDIPTDAADPVVLADEAAAKAGVVVCVAAGNSGSGFGTVADPAASPLVLSVGASTMFRDPAEDGFLAPYGKYESDGIASFSSLGPTSDGQMSPDVLAPGEDGWSVFAVTGPAAGQGVGLFSGTSQASPIAAGAVALAISAYQVRDGHAPPLGYLRQLVMNTADDLGFSAEEQGAGRVDVARAVAAIDGSGPDVSITPAFLAFSGTPGQKVTRSVTLTNSGSGAVSVKAASFGQDVRSTKSWSGKTPASQTGKSAGFAFTVPAATNLIDATAVWRTSDEQPLLVQLFDPSGQLVNYGSGGGIASIETADPVAGTWHVYVGNQNAKAESFRLEVSTEVDAPVGTLTPASVTLAPGKSASMGLTLPMPDSAGRSVTTLTLALPGGTETVPVIATVDVPSSGEFGGSFVSPSATGPDSELYTYDVVVPSSAKTISATVSWPDAGNGIELYLVDPADKAVAHSSYSVKTTTTTVAPVPASAGTWQVIVLCPVFDGLQFTLPFTGKVTSTT